jgi:hypothetical protein
MSVDRVSGRLLTARILLSFSLTIGLISWSETIQHVVDTHFTLPDGVRFGTGHARYHVLREAVHDLAAMTILAALFYGRAAWRTPSTWYVAAVLMAGYYAAFWLGAPFDPAFRAPHAIAETVHVLMAASGVAALLVARREFFGAHGAASSWPDVAQPAGGDVRLV